MLEHQRPEKTLMLPLASAAMAKIQEIKAQNLATLMASVEGGGQKGQTDSGLLRGDQRAFFGSEGKTFEAQVLGPPRAGRLALALAGQRVVITLPEAMDGAQLAQTLNLRAGDRVPVHFDAQSARLRLGLAPQTGLEPATKVMVQGVADPKATNVLPPPPLANPFPPGSLGAQIAKLSGLAFPLAEPVAQVTDQSVEPSSQALRAQAQTASLTSLNLPDAIRHALLKANAQDGPIGQAFTRLDPQKLEGGALKTMAETLMALRLDGGAKVTLENIAQALARSGLLFESRLAKGDGVSAARDLKGVLNGARAEIQAMLNGTAPEGPAQIRAIQGAIERVTLQQLASMPESLGMTITDDRAQPLRLSLSVPLAPYGLERPETAALGVMIDYAPHTPAKAELDPEADLDAPEGFPWKIRLALDLEETGPVHAEIALRGQAIGVTFWAERRAMAGRVREEIGTLHQALTQAAFEVRRLEVRDGRPSGKVAPDLPVLDRRT
jgi:Flagellar hook-length control protein FliK